MPIGTAMPDICAPIGAPIIAPPGAATRRCCPFTMTTCAPIPRPAICGAWPICGVWPNCGVCCGVFIAKSPGWCSLKRTEPKAERSEKEGGGEKKNNNNNNGDTARGREEKRVTRSLALGFFSASFFLCCCFPDGAAKTHTNDTQKKKGGGNSRNAY